MARWQLKRGMPEYHQMHTFTCVLKDGTMIEAYTADCDGDFAHWGVKENGVEVGSGQCRDDTEARLAAERIITGANKHD
jgi:hypothetical protein